MGFVADAESILGLVEHLQHLLGVR
jgi:hypothetical protein